MPGYYIENFGCRATQADGGALERQFEELGLARAANPGQAAVVVLNTCTVTAAADQDARAAIRRVQRQNPEARIVVTGCYAQRAPEEIAALAGVSCVIGNSHKHKLAEIVGATLRLHTPGAEALIKNDGFFAALEVLRHPRPNSSAKCLPLERGAFVPLATLLAPGESWGLGAGSPIFVSDIFAHTELLAAPVFEGDCGEGGRTRPNLKIQDGCDNRCSFCVIPYVRGQSRSMEMERIIREVNALVESGYREVVLSGINLGRWGRDLGSGLQASGFGFHGSGSRQRTDDLLKPGARSQKTTFASLIRAILSETSLEKLRLSSIEPMDWSDELISLVASSGRIAKHAHVPMQSGSDAVLRRMHRKYRPWHYHEKIEKIRAAMPTAAIGADVMVGFPGETDAEFEATRRMVEDLPLTYLHVFTYSARPGTPAAAMRSQVPMQVARERNRILRELAAEKKLAFMRSLVGKEMEAITLRSQGCAGESPAPTQFTEALTDNYLKLRVRGQHEANRWLWARVENVVDGVLVGTVNQKVPGASQLVNW